MNDFLFLIDNGHGINTPGKRSPDGKLRECIYTRDVARKVVSTLLAKGFKAKLLVRETYDVSLKERVRRVNSFCSSLGKDNVVLVSIHLNAFKDGKEWQSPRGWSCYTTKGKTKSDSLAIMLYEHAIEKFKNHRIRVDISDGDNDLEENFFILKNTNCPAVLTENFFMDNKQDADFLLSKEGFLSIVEVHVSALIDYFNSLKHSS